MARDASLVTWKRSRRGIYLAACQVARFRMMAKWGSKRGRSRREIRRAAADKKTCPEFHDANADGAWWLCGEICQCEIQVQIKPKN